jgi:hypothetical protein
VVGQGAPAQQAEVGWSQMASCRAALGFQLRDEWETESPDDWRATVGTALHAWLTDRLRETVAGDELVFDVATRYRGVLGHADEVNVIRREVTDYKFPSLASASVWRGDPDVLAEKMIQPHGYAAGLADDGTLPGDEPITVRLLVMPVDGTHDDWWCHEETFDPAVANRAADRLHEVALDMEAGERPPRDKPWWWCERFCPWFSACRGGYDPPEFEEITDAELAAAVESYGLAKETAGAADKERKRIAPLIRGLHGTARGWKVTMTRPQGTKLVLDKPAVLADYADRELDPPYLEVPTSSPSLMVARQKEDK